MTEACYEAECPEGVTILAFGKVYYLRVEELIEHIPYEELLCAAQLEYEG